MWDLNSPTGIKPALPALKGGVLTTRLPGKSRHKVFLKNQIQNTTSNEQPPDRNTDDFLGVEQSSDPKLSILSPLPLVFMIYL